LGRKREILMGKKSGKKSVEYKLGKMNVKATPDQVEKVLEKVKALGIKKKGLVNDDELRNIVEEVL
jgi:isopropylmalate/homocitrate/citramalate synthase